MPAWFTLGRAASHGLNNPRSIAVQGKTRVTLWDWAAGTCLPMAGVDVVLVIPILVTGLAVQRRLDRGIELLERQMGRGRE